MQRCSERAFAMCPTRHLCGTVHEATFTDDSECAEFNRKVEDVPMTNGDWIRAMSDEELATFVGHNCLCERVQGDGSWCEERALCDNCLVEWLQQPAEVPNGD